MEKPSLNDQKEFPDDAVLSQHLGDTKKAWDALTSMINENHPLYTTDGDITMMARAGYLKLQKRKKQSVGLPCLIRNLKQHFTLVQRPRN